jgi:BASS family bile acid:Na+ symporter
MSEILTVIAQISVLTFVITSMLAMGLSLKIAQIVEPLKDARRVLLALLASFVLVPGLAYLITQLIPLSVRPQEHPSYPSWFRWPRATSRFQ